MLCSVTEDSSLAAAGSHFSAAFASGAFASRSGACAATRAACPNKTTIPAAHIQKLFFIRLLPLIKFDWLATDETAGLYVGAGARVKGSALGERAEAFMVGKITSLPHTRVFFAKSVELHENKWVEFLICAKKCKRVWNCLKRKDLNIVGSDEWRVANSGVARMTPTPSVFVSADSKRLTGEFLVSADSKGVISPLFPADPRGACKCGLQRNCGKGVLEVRIVKDLEVAREAKEVKDVEDVKENPRATQWRASRTVSAGWSLANTRE